MPPASHDPVEILRERFLEAMRAAFPDSLPDGADPHITPSRNPKFGDFQANAAMALGKALNLQPRDVALRIVQRLDLTGVAEPVTDKNVAGPGFINVTLSASALADLLSAMDTPALGVPAPTHAETVAVDLCGVNLAKQMHVGHLRATVIGDALARTYERLGHTVYRQNHLGDWGLPIAMVVAAVRRGAERGDLNLNTLTLDDLDRIYRDAQRACDADEKGLAAVERFDLGPKARAELEEQAHGAREMLADAKRTLIALQSGDAHTVRLWERIAQITLDECLTLCARLNATVLPEHTAGESSYRDELAEIVQDLESRGVAVESDGALVVPLKDVGIEQPLLIRKRDGGFLYATTDLAGIRRRVRTLGAQRLVYTVDARQSLHFKQVFAAAKKAGYAHTATGADASLTHAAFGTVLGEDNRPLKTRSGENVRLAALLDESVARALDAVTQRNPELTLDERTRIAEAVGVAAIKYTDLSSDRVKDYVFSFDRMLAFEGDTGPYLLYALVRTRSIFRKARERFDDVDAARGAPFAIGAHEEKTLALTLLRYPNTLAAVADACEPHRLCAYLYELANAFSAFFAACPVLQADDAPTRLSRLRLCDLTARTLEDGLHTLGIPTLDRM